MGQDRIWLEVHWSKLDKKRHFQTNQHPVKVLFSKKKGLFDGTGRDLTWSTLDDFPDHLSLVGLCAIGQPPEVSNVLGMDERKGASSKKVKKPTLASTKLRQVDLLRRKVWSMQTCLKLHLVLLGEAPACLPGAVAGSWVEGALVLSWPWCPPPIPG